MAKKLLKDIVQIPSSHRNERKSKTNFESILDNFNLRLAFPWADNDYGIDGQVELTSQIRDSDSFRPDSKFFLVQLKSTETIKKVKGNVVFSVPVKKIIQWYTTNIPLMLVINDLTDNSFYSLWIDEKLIGELEVIDPNWVNTGSVSLKIPIENNFNNYTAETIREYVLNWKMPLNRIEPGIFFELKDKCQENINSLRRINDPFNFESVSNSLKTLNGQIEQSIYRVAITGPSRVGKSTLINALLSRKDISPPGFYQTTAVPIQIVPGKEEEVKIIFHNGPTKIEKLSPAIVKEYASQEKNEDNKKGVSLVVISLVNRLLENGVSLFDIPGLDDPNDIIYNYTWSTVSKANAIVYIIDASNFENGGYIFRREYKSNILQLGQSLDKIFLVFNKINAISKNKIDLLKEKVKQDLEKYNLYEKVSKKIYFLSAEESLEVRIGRKKGIDSIKMLEDDMWSYMLSQNKIGLFNLSSINKEIISSALNLEGILNIHLIDNERRKKLISTIKGINGKIDDLIKVYRNREADIRDGISKSLENRKHNLLLEFESYLLAIPVKTDLPNKKQLQRYLTEGALKSIEQSNIEYVHQVNLLKDLIDSWIEDNLKQVREIISGNIEQRRVDLTEIEKFESPSIDLSSSFGMGLIAGFIGFLLAPEVAIPLGILSFFSNLFLTAEDRRAKRINKIMILARKCYKNEFSKINSVYMDLITDNSKIISQYATKKVTSFLTDIETQMKKLNTEISDAEEKLYKDALEKIKLLTKNIERLNIEISGLYNGMGK